MPVPRLWIKVCGMRTREAIEAAAQAGADAVGFVFHEASPRNLTVESASALQSCVPAGVERVAVFLHPSQDLVDGVVAAIQPDWVQTDADDLATLRSACRTARAAGLSQRTGAARAAAEALPARERTQRCG